MRLPVYRFRADPAKHHWLTKKSLTYCSALVDDFLADWTDTSDVSKGIILRGYVDVSQQSMERVAGSGFSTAWSIRQSGVPGPLVWQLNTMKAVNG